MNLRRFAWALVIFGAGAAAAASSDTENGDRWFGPEAQAGMYTIGSLDPQTGYVFAVELTPDEMEDIRQEVGTGQTHGVTEDTERTYVEMTTVRGLVGPENVDWANTGMVLAALLRE